jgi:hypothetical protein
MTDPQPPSLLKATTLAASDLGTFAWDAAHNDDILTVSADGMTVRWGPRKPQNTAKHYPPAWVPATTRARLHSGRYRWDFVVDELAGAQLGVGFMLQWEIGPDWGFFGYLGASSSAWSYDPLTGCVVCETRAIHGDLPRFEDGRAGVVGVELDLPRDAGGAARFVVSGVASPTIELPGSSVILPAACLLAETQQVTLAGFCRL